MCRSAPPTTTTPAASGEPAAVALRAMRSARAAVRAQIESGAAPLPLDGEPARRVPHNDTTDLARCRPQRRAPAGALCPCMTLGGPPACGTTARPAKTQFPQLRLPPSLRPVPPSLHPAPLPRRPFPPSLASFPRLRPRQAAARTATCPRRAATPSANGPTTSRATSPASRRPAPRSQAPASPGACSPSTRCVGCWRLRSQLKVLLQGRLGCGAIALRKHTLLSARASASARLAAGLTSSPLHPTGRPPAQKGVGTEDISWQYVDAASGNDKSRCMKTWSYYSYMGSLLKANVSVSTTYDDGREW
jgi:hypothetical protein